MQGKWTDREKALALVQLIIGLGMILTYLAMVWLQRDVPNELSALVAGVVGYFFGARKRLSESIRQNGETHDQQSS